MSYCLNPNCQKPENPPQHQFCQSCGTKLLLKERYRAMKTIGQGGFGKTFLGVDEDKPRKPPCVIKQFFPSSQGTNSLEKATELFNEEAVRLDDLGKHDQIPELLAHFAQNDHLYLVQEYIEGQNLAQELQENGTFKETDIKELLTELLPVLQFIHENNVIHRDIKPENIIKRSNSANRKQFVLVDFGAARYATGTALLKTGTIIGDPRYMAPEQLSGKTDFTSDLYCLGVTCLHLLTGTDPWMLFDTSEDTWVWRDFLTTSVSDELVQVLDKMVLKATKRRFQTAMDVLNALNLSGASFPPPHPVPHPVPPQTVIQEENPFSVTPSIPSQNVSSSSKSKSKIVLTNQTVIPPLEPVKMGGKWGYKDKTGGIVTTLLLDYAGIFSEDFHGLARVQVDGKWGYINDKLEFIIELEFDDMTSFSEGLAGVKINDKWGYIDKNMRIVIQPQFDQIEPFSEGLAQVNIGGYRGKWGYIDKTGKIVIPLQFDSTEIQAFSEGLAGVNINSKWGYIDKKGKIVIQPQFVWVNPFSEGLAGVNINSKWGYIDKKGKIVIQTQFDGGGSFSEGLATVGYYNSSSEYWKYGYIDKTGKIIIKPQFKEAGDFQNGRALVTKEGFFSDKKGYIDKTGKFID